MRSGAPARREEVHGQDDHERARHRCRKFLIVEAYKHLRGRELARRIHHGEPPVRQPSRRSEDERAKRPQDDAARRKAG